jgi:hypothetical protein
MGQRTLLPDATELQLHCLKFELDTVVLIVRTVRGEAVCPGCHQPSCRTHSHYERKLADLPWNGVPVLVRNAAILLRYARLRPADLHGAVAEYRSSACATYRKTEQGCGLVHVGDGR